jgi:hypothetical protein
MFFLPSGVETSVMCLTSIREVPCLNPDFFLNEVCCLLIISDYLSTQKREDNPEWGISKDLEVICGSWQVISELPPNV